MNFVFQIVIGLTALAFFVWLCVPSGPRRGLTDSGSNRSIDPNDSRQIAQLIGMTGGAIPDAAVARYALQRFEEQHGRPATTADIGILVGMMPTMAVFDEYE